MRRGVVLTALLTIFLEAYAASNPRREPRNAGNERKQKENTDRPNKSFNNNTL